MLARCAIECALRGAGYAGAKSAIFLDGSTYVLSFSAGGLAHLCGFGFGKGGNSCGLHRRFRSLLPVIDSHGLCKCCI